VGRSAPCAKKEMTTGERMVYKERRTSSSGPYTHNNIDCFLGGGRSGKERKGKARERKKRDVSKFEHDDVKKGRNELS